MAQELEPVFKMALIVFGCPILPAILLTVFLNGRAVFYPWPVVCAAGVAYQVWYALFGDFSTGMEALVFVIVPIFLIAIGLGVLVGHAIGRVAMAI